MHDKTIKLKEKTFENNDLRFWIEEGIIFVEFLTSKVTLDIVKMSVRERLTRAEDKEYPIFFDSRNITYFEKDARRYSSSEEGLKNLKAGAFLIDSKAHEIIGNFFLAFNKPKIPTKLFTNKEKAIEWLKQYRGEE